MHDYIETERSLLGIMCVIEDHLRPSGHMMPDHAGDRGAELLVLAPHVHVHVNQHRMTAGTSAGVGGSYAFAGR